ncbi:alpha/beta hydrolase [uncultured Hoeflea sp.]|uniref:alpha/beta fold hydrolase n=1 Tax=uncultured Hoeflea sp. TaxID=538666 RepID=UPI0026344E6F|nr:alpha/beta hydrolase [uncultured Hoeflea sp.]
MTKREKLILLPGMLCDARLFGPQIDALSGTHDIEVMGIDSAESINALADQVLARAPERFNLAGLSMGGIVAMAIAGKAPERVLRLALFDTNHHADAPGRDQIRNRQIEAVRDGRMRQVVVDEMKPVYLAQINQSDQALLDLLIDMAMDLGPEVFIRQSVALRDRPDQTAALKAYRGHALVLCGAEDNLCPVERHREMAALLDHSVLRIIENAGHISTLENAAAVNAALRQWLDTPLPEPA